MNTRTMKAIKNIAFVVNENKKTELIEWSYFNKELLLPHQIIATGAAGNILEGTLNKSVNKLLSGSLGGYQQLAEMVTNGKIDAIIFFGAGDETQLHKNDFDNLMEAAWANNIVTSCNRSTTDFIFNSLLMNKNYLIDLTNSSEKVTTEQNKIKKFLPVTAE
jgi:methylglyoxal synthase